MKKLYTLKSWYSLGDAAKRLSLTLGEEVSVKDVLDMVFEEHLTLSWYMRDVAAQEIAPYMRICGWDVEFDDLINTMGVRRKRKFGAFETIFCPEPLSEEVGYINGIYTIDFEMSNAPKDWVMSLVTDGRKNQVLLDDFYVKDKDGRMWRVMEEMQRDDPFYPLPASSVGRSAYHHSYFCPRSIFPDLADLVIMRDDLEAVETLFIPPSTKKNKTEKPLITTERNTLLKIILGMAMKKYKHVPLATKNSSTQNIADDLLELDIPVDVDTVRKWLQAAKEVLP